MSLDRNPFAGTWSGKWKGKKQAGSWSLHILTDGTLSGEMNNSSSKGRITEGGVNVSGKLQYKYRYEGEDLYTGEGSMTLIGPNTLFVKWDDLDDGDSTMERTTPE